ncbi:MAG: RNA polymerase sigma factor [Patescibacteria group bacterium]
MPESTAPHKTDEQIASEVQAGDAASFGLLMERYGPKMSRYAKRFLFGYEDAEDQVQEVFLKAYANIQSFDPDRKFSSWLYRIAHNEFINAIKKKGREPLSFLDPDLLFPHPVAKERTDADANAREMRELLDCCLEKLDPKYREPLVLFYYEEMDYREIAEVLRIPVATVGVRLNRGRSAMKKHVAGKT